MKKNNSKNPTKAYPPWPRCPKSWRRRKRAAHNKTLDKDSRWSNPRWSNPNPRPKWYTLIAQNGQLLSQGTRPSFYSPMRGGRYNVGEIYLPYSPIYISYKHVHALHIVDSPSPPGFLLVVGNLHDIRPHLLGTRSSVRKITRQSVEKKNLRIWETKQNTHKERERERHKEYLY